MKWFRLHTCILDSHKVQSLPDRLFKAWINLLCVAKEHNQDGVLPTAEQVAFRLHISVPRLHSIYSELRGRRLMDDVKMHDWQEWQYASDDVTARVQKFRSKVKQGGNVSGNDGRNVSCNVSGNVSVTAQTQIQTQRQRGEAETAPPKNGTHPPPPAGQDLYDWSVAQFVGPVEDQAWQVFGAKVSTPELIEEWRANLPLWMRTKRYRDGFHSFTQFVKSGVWHSPPKPQMLEAQEEPPPKPEPTEEQKAAKIREYERIMARHIQREAKASQ